MSDARTLAELHQELAAARAEIAALRADAAAVRWLLPLARLLRRPGPKPEPALAPTAPPPALDDPAAPMAGPSRMRGSALAAYRLVRPIVRPVAWRSRSFLTNELMRELADVRAKLDLALQRLPQDDLLQDRAALSPDAGRTAERLLLTLALESRRD